MNEYSHRIFPSQWLEPEPIDDWWEQKGPLAVDLGCGKGRFLLAHAARHPDMRFLGIERMLKRVRKLDRKARRQNLDNVRILRLEGNYAVRYLFPANSVDRCFVYYPDPWPKERHAHNRIFSEEFLEALLRVLKPEGLVHFATDHRPYFEDVVDILERTPAIESVPPYIPHEEERSDFERMFMHERPANRYSFRRTGP